MEYTKWTSEQRPQDHSSRFTEALSRCHAQNTLQLAHDAPGCQTIHNQPSFYPYGMTQHGKFFENIEKELPPVFSRQVASEKIGGLISVKTLANLDSLNQGPSERVRLGKKVGYERTSFMLWLRNRLHTGKY